MIKQYKDYWIGFIITALLGAVITVVRNKTDDYPIVIEILIGTIVTIVMSSIIGIVILGVSWIFTRDFTFLRFMRISVVVCVVFALFAILGFVQGMGQ